MNEMRKCEPVTLWPTGGRPLEFEGFLVAENYLQGEDSFAKNRGYSIRIYETAGGRFVACCHFSSHWEHEPETTSLDHGTLDEILTWLEDYEPVPPGVGFPPREDFAQKQAILERQLVHLYQRVVTEVIRQLRSAGYPVGWKID